MSAILQYLLKTVKKISTYLLAGVVVLNIIALCLYVNLGVSVFVPTLSGAAITFMVLGIVLPFAAAFSPYKLQFIALYAFNLLACFQYLSSQASFIANVFVGIDGTSFPASFFIIVIFELIAAALSLVAMFFVKEPAAQRAQQAVEQPSTEQTVEQTDAQTDAQQAGEQAADAQADGESETPQQTDAEDNE